MMIKVALSGAGSTNEKKAALGAEGSANTALPTAVNLVNELAAILLLYSKVTFPKIVLQIMAKFNVTH